MTSLHELLGQRIMLWVSEEAADSWPDGLAAFILADSRIRAIIDLALRHVDRYDTPEVWALLADWRE